MKALARTQLCFLSILAATLAYVAMFCVWIDHVEAKDCLANNLCFYHCCAMTHTCNTINACKNTEECSECICDNWPDCDTCY